MKHVALFTIFTVFNLAASQVNIKNITVTLEPTGKTTEEDLKKINQLIVTNAFATVDKYNATQANIKNQQTCACYQKKCACCGGYR